LFFFYDDVVATAGCDVVSRLHIVDTITAAAASPVATHSKRSSYANRNSTTTTEIDAEQCWSHHAKSSETLCTSFANSLEFDDLLMLISMFFAIFSCLDQ
jgi:hypothetical protein